MSATDNAHITPKNTHALWLLTRAMVDEPTTQLLAKARLIFKFIRVEDYETLISIGKALGIFLTKDESLYLSDVGRSFAQAQHWRFWAPKPQTRRLISGDHGSALFIAEECLKNAPVVIDLFSGVGGLSSGFRAAGFNVVAALDNDPQACQAYAENFPGTIVIQDSVNEFVKRPSDYLDNLSSKEDIKVSGLIGGPPCQGFSYIGERLLNDERNLLASKFMDAVCKIEPDFFVMENVPGLASIGIAPDFATYVVQLAKSNGFPVASIVDELPDLNFDIGKRNKQQKRSIVTATISEVRNKLFEETASSLSTAIPSIKEHFEWLIAQLSVHFVDNFGRANIRGDIANRILSKITLQIDIIALALFVNWTVARKFLARKDVRQYLIRILSNVDKADGLQASIKRVLDIYDRLPVAQTYRGKKIGPLLSRLLRKVSAGYDVATPAVLNAASFGTPQNRERLFLVGIRKDIGKSFSFPEPTHSVKGASAFTVATPTTRDAIDDLPNIDDFDILLGTQEFSAHELKQTRSEYALKLRGEMLDSANLSLPRPNWNPYIVDGNGRTVHAEHLKKRIKEVKPGKLDKTSKRVRLHPEGLAPTLRAGTRENKGSHTAVRPIHYQHDRDISVREAARLMGYPDWMTFHETKWHAFRLIGNGVPFHLANAIARQIWSILYTDSHRSHYTKNSDVKEKTNSQSIA